MIMPDRDVRDRNLAVIPPQAGPAIKEERGEGVSVSIPERDVRDREIITNQEACTGKSFASSCRHCCGKTRGDGLGGVLREHSRKGRPRPRGACVSEPLEKFLTPRVGVKELT